MQNNLKKVKELTGTQILQIQQSYLQGFSVSMIARKIGAPLPLVFDAIKDYQEQLQTEFDLQQGQSVLMEKAKLDHLESMYWLNFQASRKKNSFLDHRTGKEVVEYKEGKVSYLHGIKSCIELRCKLLGIDGKDNNPLNERIEEIKITFVDP